VTQEWGHWRIGKVDEWAKLVNAIYILVCCQVQPVLWGIRNLGLHSWDKRPLPAEWGIQKTHPLAGTHPCKGTISRPSKGKVIQSSFWVFHPLSFTLESRRICVLVYLWTGREEEDTVFSLCSFKVFFSTDWHCAWVRRPQNNVAATPPDARRSFHMWEETWASRGDCRCMSFPCIVEDNGKQCPFLFALHISALIGWPNSKRRVYVTHRNSSLA